MSFKDCFFLVFGVLSIVLVIVCFERWELDGWFIDFYNNDVGVYFVVGVYLFCIWM